jgi:hypothetical protein
MAHGCKNWLVRCMDFRLWHPINEWAEARNLSGDCDLISLAGTMKGLIDEGDPAVKEFLLSQIAISHDKHGARVGYILDHTDCGAWGGRAAFDSPESDFNHHVNVLKKVKTIVSERFPDMTLHLFILVMEGDMVVDSVAVE